MTQQMMETTKDEYCPDNFHCPCGKPDYLSNMTGRGYSNCFHFMLCKNKKTLKMILVR